jgi:hypothetical protein
MRINEILNESTLFEGKAESYKGYVIKSFPLPKSGIAVAWVGDRDGNQVSEIAKRFPKIEAGTEEEAIDIQKQKIDAFMNTDIRRGPFRAYPNTNLQSMLGLNRPGRINQIYMGLDSGGVVYISPIPQPELKKGQKDPRDNGTAVSFSLNDLRQAGLEPGTRYQVIGKHEIADDMWALEVKEFNRITHSNDRDDNKVPLIVVQWSGRSEGLAYEAVNPAQQAAIAISKKKEQGIDEGETWSKHNNKRVGGMSKKSVKSYRRSHPGSKIQTAVTTKPSKLKKGSKDAKRRKSFCARMKGMKKHNTSSKTARDPNSNINKSLRRWNCESVEQMEQLVILAEQFLRKHKV